MEQDSSPEYDFSKYRNSSEMIKESSKDLIIPRDRISTRILFNSIDYMFPDRKVKPPNDKYNTCIEFSDIIKVAENVVDFVIEEAQNSIRRKLSKGYLHYDSSPSNDTFISLIMSHREYSIIHYDKPQFTSWPTIKDFTVKLGASKINEYLSSFNTEEDWLYAIYYLNEIDLECETIYNYKATWSLPCGRYPIAQATAHVYFTIEASKVVPPFCLVKVTFSFETFSFKHKPGVSDFKEEWLNYILDSKINIFKRLKF